MVKTGTRLPILLSSSTLNEWQGKRYQNQYAGDTLHVDQLCIPGATIKTLTRALESEYAFNPVPIDVLLVGGLNDLLRDKSARSIEDDLRVLQRKVEELVPGETNTLAIATIFCPPKYTTLGGGAGPADRERKERLIELNFRIMKLNDEQEQNTGWRTNIAPKFHSWDTVTKKKTKEFGLCKGSPCRAIQGGGRQ